MLRVQSSTTRSCVSDPTHTLMTPYTACVGSSNSAGRTVCRPDPQYVGRGYARFYTGGKVYRAPSDCPPAASAAHADR